MVSLIQVTAVNSLEAIQNANKKCMEYVIYTWNMLHMRIVKTVLWGRPQESPLSDSPCACTRLIIVPGHVDLN